MTTINKPRPKTRRRGNGEGSIYQRSTGRWEACITVGYDSRGKRVRRTIYGWTKAEVQDELTKLQGNKLDGTLVAPSRQTVAVFLPKWLEDCARPTLRATTHDNYKRAIDLHIVPRIGGAVLNKLTAAHVQGMYAAMERDSASAYTIRLCHAVLRLALKRAMKWNLIGRNPVDAVEPPRLPEADIHPLDADQVAVLLKAAKGDRLETLYVLAVATGLRLGELFALQWEDIDLPGRALQVRHNQAELNGIVTLTDPKTAKSRRRVDLPDMAVRSLEDHRKRAMAAGQAGADRVFCNLSGNPLRRSHFHAAEFRPLLIKAKIPHTRFHNLRHTSATLLLSAGTNPKVVQERLGHSQISITMDTYSHVLPTMQLEAAGKLDAILTAKPARKRKAAGA